MILPIWGQGCVVTYRDQKVLGEVHGYYIDPQGRYRLNVWSRMWGYDLAFPAADMELLSIIYESGEVYDAESAFRAKFTVEQRAAMADAEQAHDRARPAPVDIPQEAKALVREQQARRAPPRPMTFVNEQQAVQAIAKTVVPPRTRLRQFIESAQSGEKTSPQRIAASEERKQKQHALDAAVHEIAADIHANPFPGAPAKRVLRGRRG